MVRGFMKRLGVALALAAVMLAGGIQLAAQATAPADVVAAVRAAIERQNLPQGEKVVAEYRAAHGATPEAIEALSWLARGALAAKRLDEAGQHAEETYTLAVAALKTMRLERSPSLQTALGAAIETRALVQAERGARSDAVYGLQRDLETYRDTPIHKRIAKNINLLSLEGQAAPPLEAGEYLGVRVPSFAELKGRVVLLLFWAHWCPDCKAESPIVARLLEKYRAQGLAIVAPTQRYGYVAEGREAPPDEELRYIAQVRDTYYGFLRSEPVPVSEANHKRYGVSSTPTLALVDRQGIVRLYHPGRMTEQELDTAIQKLLVSPAPSLK